ncbi:RidA family protein [Paenibacillus pinihumi]|uniref:RidA family protein n=1 Tax=Paenibacillus pinihumi TaxID=669462 RepID=UPI0006877CDB|nr:RidA family protein [Paenibacillus pinihumi]
MRLIFECFIIHKKRSETMKNFIKSDLPLAYSDAVIVDKLIFVAGQGPDRLDIPVREQIRQTIENIEKVLAKANASLRNIIKITVILNYEKISPQLFEDVYKEFFEEPYPARTVFESGIGFNVQIDAIAIKDE